MPWFFAQDFLNEFTADQFRMFCLMHKYHSNVEYSSDRMVTSLALDFCSHELSAGSLMHGSTCVFRASFLAVGRARAAEEAARVSVELPCCQSELSKLCGQVE